MKTYFRMLKYMKPYMAVLALMLVTSFSFVMFNSASIWMSASFIKVLFPDEAIEQTTTLSAEKQGLQSSGNSDVTADLIQDQGEVIDSLNERLKNLTNRLILRETPKDSLLNFCLILLIIFILKNIFFYIKNISLGYLQYNLITDLRNELYSKIQSLPLSFFDRKKSGGISSIMINDVEFIRASLTNSLNKILVEPLNVVVFTTGLFIISWRMALIALLILPISGKVISIISSSIRRKSKRSSKQIAGIMSVINEALSGIRIIKAFNMEEFEKNRFYQETRKYFRLLFRRNRLRAASTPINEIVVVLIGMTLLYFGGLHVLTGDGLSSEDFLRFILLLFSLFQPIKKINQAVNKIQQGVASADRIFELLDEENDIVEKGDAVELTELSSKIEYKHIDFKYDTSDVVLKKINFTINKGESVAFVGHSGAGKSTIIDLLPRFYDVKDGGIYFDGSNIKDVTISSLRRQIGIVSQETVLFNDTIFNNIAYGKSDASLEDVKAAARAANAEEFIESLPDKYDTEVGENGVQFSGGQRQRLAIARALLKNPPVLILDEATSSLDMESEQKVQEAIDNLMKYRTVLVVAHRLSTIKNVDKIVVLEKGEIVEMGTHEELSKKENSYYYKLYKMQLR